MDAKTVAQNEMKWAKGYKMTVRDWMRFCELSSDSRFNNLYWAMDWAMSTGRLPNWERGADWEQYFTKNGKRLSNVQVRNLLARAAESQEKMTQSDGLRALQSAFGVSVR